MAHLIRMPEVLAGAAEASIQTWLVGPGASLVAGQALAEIETDKAIVELTSEVDGVVARLLAAEGDQVAVGDAILLVAAPGETADDAVHEDAVQPERTAVTHDTAVEPDSRTALESAAVAARLAEALPPDRLRTTPIVRRLAAQAGIDLAVVHGTGEGGRVVRRDLEKHLRQRAAGAPDTGKVDAAPAHRDVPLTRMRRTIARRLTESVTTVPHFSLAADCRVDTLLALREQVNAVASQRCSVTDYVLKAAASAFVDVPAANAVWNGDSIRTYSSADISVAIATDGGLLAPVLRGVDGMSVAEIGSAVRQLSERARAGRVEPTELEGGSFAVSNLGMYGTSRFTAIINPPQSGILAVGVARRQPVVDADGSLTVGTVMTVTLSADHRVLDGALAAQWLAAFQHRIESPLSLLI